MATPSTTISFSDLRTEIGSTGAISMGDGAVRDLVGRAGIIDMNTAKSKTYNFSFTVDANSSGQTLTSLAVYAGWTSTGSITATIPAGTTVSTIYTGTTSWGNITLINNGTIMGYGGTGGSGGGGTLDMATWQMSASYGGTGSSGGWGLYNYPPTTNRVQRSHILYNNGIIAGGGGGGGGGCSSGWGTQGVSGDAAGGGGGGGGRGNPGGAALSSNAVAVINGAGNAYPGAAGTAGTTAGAGGGGGGASDNYGKHTGDGGAGGNLGAGGAAGGNNTSGWGYFGSASSGGSAIGNNATLTTITAGTIIGAIS